MQDRNSLIELITRGRRDVTQAQAGLWADYLLQLKNCHLFSVAAPEKDKAEWLRHRRSGIGGSEIAAIIGENHWNSPRQIWMSKMGMFDDKPPQQSEAARWGNLLETVVADEWALRNKRQYIHIPVIIQDDDHPHLLANIDGFTLSDDRETITGILEIKTTSAYNRDAWENGPLPYHYLCQTNWYCGITGLSNYTIVCLVGGQRLYAYDMPADPELFAREVEAADEFWSCYVIPGVEPPATAVDKELLAKADAAALAEKQTTVEDGEPAKPPAVLDDDETERMVEGYCKLREQMAKLKEVKDALHARIRLKLGDSVDAITKTHTISLSVSNRRTCNFDKLKQLSPELYDEVVSITVGTQMNIN